MKFCAQCGASLSPGARFCGACGAATAPAAAAPDNSDDATRLAPTSGSTDATQSAPTTHALPTRPAPVRNSGWESAAPGPHRTEHGAGQAHPSGEPGRHTSSASPRVTHAEPSVTDPGPSPKRSSRAPLIAAGIVAALLVGGGGGLALTKLGDHDSSSKAPAASVNGPSGSTRSAAAKPASMPDLKGKTVDEARSLLSGSVKLDVTSNLVENMDGAEKITSQNPAPGTATPGSVKVNVDQPANVTYLDQDNDLVVDSNPFSAPSDSQDASVNGQKLSHPLTASMYGGSDTQPETLDLNLNRSFKRFRTQVGEASNSEDSSKRFVVTIKGDDRQLWRQTVGFHDKPQNVDLDVSGVLRLTVEVTVDSGDDDKSSSIVFGAMRVLSEPGAATNPTDSPTS